MLFNFGRISIVFFFAISLVTKVHAITVTVACEHGCTNTCSTGCTNITQDTYGMYNFTWDVPELTENAIMSFEFGWGLGPDKYLNILFNYLQTPLGKLIYNGNDSYFLVLPYYYMPAGDYYHIVVTGRDTNTVLPPSQTFGPMTIDARDNMYAERSPVYPFDVSVYCEDESSCSEDQTVAYIGENIIVKWTVPVTGSYSTAEIRIYWGNPELYNSSSSWDGWYIVNTGDKYAPEDGEKGVKYPITSYIPPGNGYYISVHMTGGAEQYANSYAGAFHIAPSRSGSNRTAATFEKLVAGCLLFLMMMHYITF